MVGIDGNLPYCVSTALEAAYIASQKPSRQCSCRIEPHRNLHCMPGSGQSKAISVSRLWTIAAQNTCTCVHTQTLNTQIKSHTHKHID